MLVLRPAALAERDQGDRVEAEPLGHFKLDDAASSADSEGSWREMSSEALERMLQTAFRPGAETLQEFERRQVSCGARSARHPDEPGRDSALHPRSKARGKV